MKLTATKTLILIVLVTMSHLTNLKRRKIKRLKLEKRKAEHSDEFKNILKSNISHILLENPIGGGACAMVYEVKDKNLVAKVTEYSEINNKFANKELESMKETKNLPFSLPLCGHLEIKKNQEEIGLALFLPKAKMDLTKLAFTYNTVFDRTMIPIEQLAEAKKTNWFRCSECRSKFQQNEDRFTKKLHTVMQMALGLKEFNEATESIHGDVKLENFLAFEGPSKWFSCCSLPSYSKIVLSDFGFVKPEGEKIESDIVGTLEYIPFFDFCEENQIKPETKFEQESDVSEPIKIKPGARFDQKFDVYGLGFAILNLLNRSKVDKFIINIRKSVRRAKYLKYNVLEDEKQKMIDLLKTQREEYIIPERQIQLEDYVIDRILVSSEERVTLRQLVNFLELLDSDVFSNVKSYYQTKPVECDSIPKSKLFQANLGRNERGNPIPSQRFSLNQGNNQMNPVNKKSYKSISFAGSQIAANPNDNSGFGLVNRNKHSQMMMNPEDEVDEASKKENIPEVQENFSLKPSKRIQFKPGSNN